MTKAVSCSLLAFFLLSGAAHSGQTTDSGDGRVEIRADVEEAKLEEDPKVAEFRINFGTSPTGDTTKTWSNGVVFSCSAENNTVSATGASQFSFAVNDVDASRNSKVDVFTEEKGVEKTTSRGIILNQQADRWTSLSVWAGVGPDGMRNVVAGLLKGETVYFRIEEPGSSVKSIDVAFDNYKGHNLLTAFAKDCEHIWAVPLLN